MEGSDITKATSNSIKMDECMYIWVLIVILYSNILILIRNNSINTCVYVIVPEHSSFNYLYQDLDMKYSSINYFIQLQHDLYQGLDLEYSSINYFIQLQQDLYQDLNLEYSSINYFIQLQYDFYQDLLISTTFIQIKI